MKSILTAARRRYFFIPEGLIIAYDGSTTPTNWSLFTDANDKLIVGAGSHYTVGESQNSSYWQGVTSWTGNHVGVYGDCSSLGSTMTSSGYHQTGTINNDSDGNHNHSIFGTYMPAYQKLKLIKATKDVPYLPANSIVFTSTTTNPGNLTGKYNSDYYFGAGDSVTYVSSDFSYESLTSYDGIHTHGNYFEDGDMQGTSGYLKPDENAGQHAHNVTACSLSSADIKRAYLKAWTHTLRFNVVKDIIAMWESSTPPDNWVLCDGNNGTLDLRNYFIKMTDSEDVGTRQGNNSLQLNVTLNTTGAHNHMLTYENGSASASIAHSNETGDHTHSVKCNA